MKYVVKFAKAIPWIAILKTVFKCSFWLGATLISFAVIAVRALIDLHGDSDRATDYSADWSSCDPSERFTRLDYYPVGIQKDE